MRYIETLKDGERISEVYLCKSKSIALTKTGKEYANVMLADKTGQIDSKIWDLNSGGIAEFDVNDYVAVTGQVTSYNGALQFKIERARIASENEYVAADYVPSSRYNIDNMFAELMKYVDSVKSTYMKQLLYSFFKDETFAKKFKCVSAAKTVHHGFSGGLLEHTLSVTRMCDYFATSYSILNRDLLLSSAILHDIGKVKELSDFPDNDYTDEGQLIGHIVIGVEMINDAIRSIPGFPEKLAHELKHCIVAHHGELEYGSPKKPALAEAVALNMADSTDAKLQTLTELFKGKTGTDWLGYNRLFESNLRRASED